MPIPSRYPLNNLFFPFSLLLLAGYCQFFRGPDDVVSISISSLNMSIQPGSTQQFSATGIFGACGTGDVTAHTKWASSNPGRVTINSTGLATAIAYGTVTIYATYECSGSETSLSVVNQAAAPSSIAVVPQSRRSLITHSARQTPNENTIAAVGAVVSLLRDFPSLFSPVAQRKAE